MGTRISGRPTFGGLASGLDTNAILDGLMAIERQPLQRIQSRRGEVENQRSLVRQLNSRLLALRNAARDLDNRSTKLTSASTSEEFLKYTSASTNDEIVEVSAGFGAAPGDIQVRVEQLARGSRRFSTTFTAADVDAATALQTGQSMTIALPNADPNENPPFAGTSITISATSGALSLADLRDQINTSADNGGKVRADILQISEGNFQLVLTSTEAGTENELAVTGDLAIQAVNPDGSDNAQSAVIHLFGQRIERNSNTIDDVLTGVTLKLKGVAELDENDQPITETVSVQTDVEAITKAVEGFVSAYNDVMSFIETQSNYDETKKSAGPLSGDFMVRDVQSRLRDLVSTAFRFQTNPNNPFARVGVDANGRPYGGGSVSGVGIELVGDGKIRLNKEKLEEVLAQDAASVREFFSGRTRTTIENQAAIDYANAYNAGLGPNPDREDLLPVPEPDFWDAGFFTSIGEKLEEIVRTGDGLLAERDKMFARRLDQIDDSIERFNARLSIREEMLVARFTALEGIIAGLQNQQGFLGGIR